MKRRLVENSLSMSGIFYLWPTKTLLGLDVLLGGSFRPSSKRRSPRDQTSTLGRSAIIVKRSRLSSNGSAKMCWMCWTSLSSPRLSPANRKSSTTRCMLLVVGHCSTSVRFANILLFLGRETTIVILLSLLRARSVRLPQPLPMRPTRYQNASTKHILASTDIRPECNRRCPD